MQSAEWCCVVTVTPAAAALCGIQQGDEDVSNTSSFYLRLRMYLYKPVDTLTPFLLYIFYIVFMKSTDVSLTCSLKYKRSHKTPV